MQGPRSTTSLSNGFVEVENCRLGSWQKTPPWNFWRETDLKTDVYPSFFWYFWPGKIRTAKNCCLFHNSFSSYKFRKNCWLSFFRKKLNRYRWNKNMSFNVQILEKEQLLQSVLTRFGQHEQNGIIFFCKKTFLTLRIADWTIDAKRSRWWFWIIKFWKTHIYRLQFFFSLFVESWSKSKKKRIEYLTVWKYLLKWATVD